MPNPPVRPLDAKHQEIAQAYGYSFADVTTGMRRIAAREPGLAKRWWLPGDATHPGEMGYAVYAQVVWDSYLEAVQRRVTGKIPAKMLNAPTYLSAKRFRLSSLAVLPKGWRRDQPNRISAWYDALMSRWLDDELVCENPQNAPQQSASLRVRFRGETVLLFGEATLASGKHRVLIDGQPAQFQDGNVAEQGVFDASAAHFGGNMHHVRVLAQNHTSNTDHTLEIQPLLEVGQELRIESLCVTGQEIVVYTS